MGLAANAIISLAEAKAYIKTESNADDTLIETIIDGTSTLFESYCDTHFINLALTERYDGNGQTQMLLSSRPITVLTQVKYAELWDDALVRTLTDYEYNVESGILRNKYGIFPAGFQNLEIQYTAGRGANIAAMPEDLKLACKKQAAFFYKRDAADFSDTFGESVIIKAPADTITPVVKGMLAPYMNLRVG